MSKALQEKIKELFEATKNLQSFEEIKAHCDRFNAWVSESNYSEKSLGTLLSRYGLYKLFQTIPLFEDKNAALIAKHNAEGSVKSYELKHYVPLLCGLNKEQWNNRNQSTRTIDRLENGKEIDPERYIETTEKLLTSEDPHELAVGLIAATGRRPHEILARGKFKQVQGKPYKVSFSGQGKKRGEKPVFEIDTLLRAEYVVKCLNKLRFEPSTAQLLKEVKNEFPDSITRQNIEIDKRRNGSLNRVVRSYFGDTGQNNPVLSFRHGDKQDNNKALRAACAVLVTERECKGSYGAKIVYASKFLGHISKEVKSDRELNHLVTSAGYSDYYVTKPIPYPSMSEQKITTTKVSAYDLEKIKELQKTWGLRSQHEVVSRLLKSSEEIAKLQRQLLEAQNQIAQLEQTNQELNQEIEQMPQQEVAAEPAPGSENLNERMEKLEQLVYQLVEKIGTKASVADVPTLTAIAVPRVTMKAESDKDWSEVNSEELKGSKARGAADEKILRSFQALANYNDNVAASNSERWYIGNVTLRQLSGCNGQLVGDWIKRHQLSVDDHNNKYGLGQYHNKGRGDVTSVVSW
ncbi:hypothetical protein NIES4106_59740 (plasmid) [Fischerella sp. NIES-4106]|nr:hypothetical protein NIES4106_59740 [Fischerella sp. NIES-4106]